MNGKLVEGDDIYRLMVERILDSAIFMLDADGLVATWNAGGERILGYCAKEIIGRHCSAFYPREEARSGKPERDLLAAAAENRFEASGWRLRKDGSRIWAQVSVRPIRDQAGDLLGFVTLARDLTEQKRNLDELWRSQDRFQRAVESAPNAMIMINRAGRIVMLNLQAEILFGYTRDELLAHPVEKLIPARFRKRHREERIAFFASPQSRPMGAGRDLFALKKDGTEFPVEIGLNVIETDEGPMVLASIVDITARKEHEEALLRSQERFRRAIESAPNAMVMVSHKGRIEMVNLTAEELFGYARGELTGRPVEMLIPERFRRRHRNERLSFFAHPEKRLIDGRELAAVKKDGSEFPVEIGLNPIETEEGPMVLAAIIDMTERKRKEDALRRSYESFRLVVEAAPSGRIMVNRAGGIELVNAEMERICDYPRAELLGQHVDKIIPVRFRAEYARIRESFFAAPAPWPLGSRGEFQVLRKDGSEIPVEAGLNLIETEEGPMLIAAVVDITERKRKEERLQAALEGKEALLGEIHRRVKNNLQTVSSLLRLQSADIKDEAALDVFRQCQDHIQSIALIHETLRRTNNFGQVDFAQFLNSLAEALKSAYAIDPDRIAVSIAAEPVHLPVDIATPCGQIVSELLTNAFKHAFPEGRSGTITISLVTDAVGVILSVTDDGIGITGSAERAQAATAGLRLAGLLIEQLGGILSIRKANPTRFILQFPCEGRPTRPPADGAPEPLAQD